jgi:phage tail sheath protein FI
LDALDVLDVVDLVCAPDIAAAGLRPGEHAVDLARDIVDRCDLRGRRIAVLDSIPSMGPVAYANALRSDNAALYHPWLRPSPGPDGDPGFVPPCGHVAGVIAATDARIGVHKAPANEALNGVLDLAAAPGPADQAEMNDAGVNLIRAFPGRGIRVWGARTLSPETAWTYLPVRRQFLTAARWVEHAFGEPLFEPAGPDLWARIELALTEYFAGLFRRGALKGATPEEAFFVRCDAETNPPSERDAGRVVAKVGLAPAAPSEFVVVHITRDADGVSIAGPSPG